jgi:ribonuclease III
MWADSHQSNAHQAAHPYKGRADNMAVNAPPPAQPEKADKLTAAGAALTEWLIGQLGFSPPFDVPLYQLALTHSSYTYENRFSHLENYERLEFLGDAVLKIIVSEYLYDRFPQYREGELTKIRSVIISDAYLAELAKKIGLSRYLVFGASEAKAGGARKVSNLACGMEALMGALFLDGKMAELRNLLVAHWHEDITRVDLDKTKDNYKAVLQELTQSEGIGLPEYITVEETGPAHNRRFVVNVVIQGELVGSGIGKTKKEAQQHAAKEAVAVFEATLAAACNPTMDAPFDTTTHAPVDKA